jgi:hypothetical protein
MNIQLSLWVLRIPQLKWVNANMIPFRRTWDPKNGAEPSLFCASLDSKVPNGVALEGGQVESFVEDMVKDSRHGLLSSDTLGDVESEASPVTKNLRLAVEVGNIVCLSCDGLEGMQVDCLKQIVVEIMGKGEAVSILLISKRKRVEFRRGVIAVIIKHKILSWNVRGLNDRDKQLRISNLIRIWRANIVCFQETKMQSISSCFVQSLWGCPYVDWCLVDSRGASGGILLMWDSRVVSRIDSCLGKFVVACNFRNVDDGLVWAFAGVYGPNRDHI